MPLENRVPPARLLAHCQGTHPVTRRISSELAESVQLAELTPNAAPQLRVISVGLALLPVVGHVGDSLCSGQVAYTRQERVPRAFTHLVRSR
jgi:hypothetical protein